MGASCRITARPPHIHEPLRPAPWYRSRQRHGVAPKRLRRLMARGGGAGCHLPAAEDHGAASTSPRLPHLLRNIAIEEPARFWCVDIAYIPMRRGFLYRVTFIEGSVMAVERHSGDQILHRDAGGALSRFGRAGICYAHQGASSPARASPRYCWTSACGSSWMVAAGGRTTLLSSAWQLMKCECIYSTPLRPVPRPAWIGRWFSYYSRVRRYSALAGRTRGRSQPPATTLIWGVREARSNRRALSLRIESAGDSPGGLFLIRRGG